MVRVTNTAHSARDVFRDAIVAYPVNIPQATKKRVMPAGGTAGSSSAVCRIIIVAKAIQNAAKGEKHVAPKVFPNFTSHIPAQN